MTLDQELLAKVRERIGLIAGIEEKKIVGGTGFMLRGRLILGVGAKGLLVRVANPGHLGFLGEEGASPMVMGGRSSRGWLVVPSSNLRSAPLLDKWVARAIESAEAAGPP